MYRLKAPSKKILVTVTSLVSLVIIVGALGLFLSGRLAVVWKQSSERAAASNKLVCGDDIVATYNRVAFYKNVVGSDKYVLDESGMKNLANDIKNKSSYQSDPTCQTILLLVAVHNQDYKSAKNAYDAVNALHAKHIYADSNLNTGASLSSYEALVKELSPANKDGGNQGAQGGA